ncbi:hypothetical protein [Nocardia sp. BMG51109]|uniref:hypothetical protein n=1 Tax=Nocardia sp. BMG51109 TaxID=1056816 RepID=UPI000467390C|nr:hypothetical protein [Nocardia sp. BMG51109]
MKLGVDPNEWKGLLAQANAGQLTLDPEVGRGLDKVCDDHIDSLNAVLDKVRDVTHITGFGTFNSGQVLERKFSVTASGDERALDAVIMQHIDAVQTAKEVVAKAIANFTAQDQAAASQIAATEGPR